MHKVMFLHGVAHMYLTYGKCPKILYIKVSDKIPYANNVEPDQTAPERAVWSGYTLFVITPSILISKS